MYDSGTNGSCEITIRWNGADNKIDRLSALLRDFAQEESLSVQLTVHRVTRLVIQGEDRVFRCRAQALRYVTSDGHYCVCHLTGGEVRLRIAFRDIAAQLESAAPGAFLVISRGVLVSIRHIRRHTRAALYMDDGVSLPIRRSDRTRIQAWWEERTASAEIPPSRGSTGSVTDPGGVSAGPHPDSS